MFAKHLDYNNYLRDAETILHCEGNYWRLENIMIKKINHLDYQLLNRAIYDDKPIKHVLNHPGTQVTKL